MNLSFLVWETSTSDYPENNLTCLRKDLVGANWPIIRNLSLTRDQITSI